MRLINIKEFLSFLNDNNISFKVEDSYDESYQVASFFEPIEKGFYFFIGENIPSSIKSSFIITNNLVKQKSNDNVFIVIDENPQMVYYNFLSYCFPEFSTGIIHDSAIINPNAKIGKNVQIDCFCVIGNCIIGDNTIIKSHSIIHDNTKLGENTIIESHSIIGARGLAWVWDKKKENKIIEPQLGGVEIGNYCILASNTIVVRGSLNENTKIGNYTLFAPGCRIGHGTKIGNFVHFANNVVTGGNTIIGSYSFIGSSVTFRPKVKIHKYTVVGAGAVVVKNTSKEKLTLIGMPAKENLTKDKQSGIPF